MLTGGSGSGKTNCLLNLIVAQNLYSRCPVIWYPLFRFDPTKGLQQNLQEHLQSILDEPMSDVTIALSELLRRSDTILVLDGLDELSIQARINKGT